MGNAVQRRFITEAEYLAGELDAAVRHEFVDGELYAMAGASRAHTAIVANVVAALRPGLLGSGCRIASSDMKVRLAEGRRYYYPDVVVSCNDARDEPSEYVETRPTLLVEVLSESTEATDRREKRTFYQSLDTVVDYALVSQTSRTVELYTRTSAGWAHSVHGEGETMTLPSVDLELAIDAVYADVTLSQG